ncbi:MAG: MFS transporter [Candidatus Hodarchaeales archaeon]|jgi:MFS family permease
MTKLIFLYIAVIFGPLSGSAVISLIDPFRETFNVDLGMAVLVITVYTLPFAFTQLFSGAIADAFSKKKTLVIGLALYGILTIFVGFSPTIEFLFLTRFLQGIFGAFQIPIIIGIIGESTEEKRGQAFGLLAVFVNIGLAFGPLLAGVLESFFSWRIFFYILGIMGTCTAIIIHFFFDYEEKKIFLSDSFRSKTTNILKFMFRVMRNRQVQIFAISTTVAFTGMVNTYIYVTTYMKDNAYSQIIASIPVTMAGVVGIFIGFYSGKSVDKFGSKNILYFGLIISIIAEGLIIFILEANIVSIFISMVFLMILIGLANVFLQASANTIATEIDPDLKATVASYAGVLRFIGFALIPFFTPIYEHGFGTLMIFSIILIVIGMFLLKPLSLGEKRTELPII